MQCDEILLILIKWGHKIGHKNYDAAPTASPPAHSPCPQLHAIDGRLAELSQYAPQYLLPFAAGQLHPGWAHFRAFFSAMSHLLASVHLPPPGVECNPPARVAYSIGIAMHEEAMPEPSKEELLQKIAELEQQLHGRKPSALEFRVSDKGAVSVYRLGRFPVTLYYEQWVRLLDHAEELRAFLETNKGKLKMKGQSEAAGASE
jgi:hypothetical protein